MGIAVHVHNPSYLEARDQEEDSSRITLTKSWPYPTSINKLVVMMCTCDPRFLGGLK
jgi:hypothetical protein